MQTNIKILVYAQDKSEAEIEAARVANLLVRINAFDSVSIDSISKHSSKKGDFLVREGVAQNAAAFIEGIGKVRRILESHDDAHLYESEYDIDSNIRFWCGRLADAHHVFMFDDDGEAIFTPAHLKSVLDGWPSLGKKQQPKEGEVVWVAEAYTHY